MDAIQLHGDEPLELAESLLRDHRWPLIRAIKLPTTPLEVAEIEALARPWIDLGCHPLLDADAGAAHGGSGKTLDWNSIRHWRDAFPETRFTLAGGLNPENVAEAIGTTATTRRRHSQWCRTAQRKQAGDPDSGLCSSVPGQVTARPINCQAECWRHRGSARLIRSGSWASGYFADGTECPIEAACWVGVSNPRQAS